MTNLILIGLALVLLANALVVYFTFSTWYGQKKSKMVPYTIDKDGKMHFDLKENE
jgi:ABC-type uncharacterized transport system permease subunit